MQNQTNKACVDMLVKIHQVQFLQADNYQLVIKLQEPQTASKPNEPTKQPKTPKKKSSALPTGELIPTLLITAPEKKYETNLVFGKEPVFEPNEFLFTVTPVTLLQEETLVLNLDIEVYSKNQESKLVGKVIHTLTHEEGTRLLKREKVLLMLDLEGKLEPIGKISVTLGVPSGEDVAIAEPTNDNFEANAAPATVENLKSAKVSDLVKELRFSSEVHLKILEETNKMKNSRITDHLKELDEELKQRRIVVEKLLEEMQQKNETLEVYKKTNDQHATTIKSHETEIQALKNRIQVHQKNEKLAMDENKLVTEVIHLQEQLKNMGTISKQKEELQDAHRQQSLHIEKQQKKIKALKKFKDVSVKQEQVIKKLETLLQNVVNSNYQSAIHKPKGIREENGPIASNKTDSTEAKPQQSEMQMLRKEKELAFNELEQSEARAKILEEELKEMQYSLSKTRTSNALLRKEMEKTKILAVTQHRETSRQWEIRVDNLKDQNKALTKQIMQQEELIQQLKENNDALLNRINESEHKITSLTTENQQQSWNVERLLAQNKDLKHVSDVHEFGLDKLDEATIDEKLKNRPIDVVVKDHKKRSKSSRPPSNSTELLMQQAKEFIEAKTPRPSS